MTKRYFREPAKGLSELLASFQKDDLVLLGLILFLIGDGCEDKELLLILAYLFVSGRLDSDRPILSHLGNFFNTSN